MNRMICFTSFVLLVAFTACKENKQVNDRQFGIFKVLDDNTTLEMNGVINSQSLDNFNRLIVAYPSIQKINIKECEGSMDDDTNLKLSALIHQKKIDIHLLDNGLVASGGTDFFLAGIQRTKGANTRIGVHAWSDGTQEATAFPVGHIEHQKYIDYYVSVGFVQSLAERFYYFTIEAAPAASIHWMTDSEIKQYNIVTP